MATIKFIEAEADATKGFKMGRTPSLFVNNVTFQITGTKFGNYTVDGVATKNADKAQAILFTTSVGEDLALNRLLRNRRVVYDKDGTAQILPAFREQAELSQHLESLGRREDDETMLKGSVSDVAKHALKFFEGKTLICIEVPALVRDDKGKLVAPFAPIIQFGFKE